VPLSVNDNKGISTKLAPPQQMALIQNKETVPRGEK